MTVVRDMLLQRCMIYKMNNQTGRDQLQRIADALSRNQNKRLRVEVGSIDGPEEMTQENSKYRYRYTGTLRIIKDSYRNEETANRVIDEALVLLNKVANTNAWQVMGEAGTARPASNSIIIDDEDDSDDGNVPGDRPGFKLPELDEKVFATYFNGIFERESYIRTIHKATIKAVKTAFRKRTHTLLYGEPSACKSVLFEQFKKWYEESNGDGYERVLILDGPTMSKAGLENLLIKRAQAKELPEFLFFEEIEKHQPDNLLCLLSIMTNGRLQRVNSRAANNRVVEEIPSVIWATCNDASELEKFHKGALLSRFSAWECRRPGREVMKKILFREIYEMEGNPDWVEPALDLAWNVLKTNDPRRIISLLDGGDDLLNGSFQKDLLNMLNIEEVKHGETLVPSPGDGGMLENIQTGST